MTLIGILIGTAILWGLSFLVVRPLARYLQTRQLKQKPEYAHLFKEGGTEGELDEAQQKSIQSLATRSFILADVAVLGIAGFLIGLFSGHYFVGISLGAKSWPGMIAFIILSIGGSALHARVV